MANSQLVLDLEYSNRPTFNDLKHVAVPSTILLADLIRIISDRFNVPKDLIIVSKAGARLTPQTTLANLRLQNNDRLNIYIETLKVHLGDGQVLSLEISKDEQAHKVYEAVHKQIGYPGLVTLLTNSGAYLSPFTTLKSANINYEDGLHISKPVSKFLIMEHRGLHLFKPKQSVLFVDETSNKTSSGPGKPLGVIEGLNDAFQCVHNYLNMNNIKATQQQWNYDPITESYCLEMDSSIEFRIYDLTRFL